MIPKIFKILRRLFIGSIVLLIAVWVLLQLPPVQTWLVHQATHQLSKNLRTTINIEHVDFSLFNRMNLEGVYVQDRNKDTLLYAGLVQVRITDWFFFKDDITLKYIGLKNAIIKTQRKDSVWNYQFLADYFSSSDTSTSTSNTKLNLQQVQLENIRFTQKDIWKGNNMCIALGALTLKADGISTKQKKYHIRSIDLYHPSYVMQNYKGLEQKINHALSLNKNTNDSLLQWNPNHIQLLIDNISITDGLFGTQKLNTKTTPYFDGNNIVFEKINGTLNKVQWLDDTISTQINLRTQERSGLQVNALQTNFSIHPQAMIFDSLLLRTRNSELRNYFAMHYKSMDDLSQFEQKVQLKANLTQATLATSDIAFFAPDLQSWKMKFLLTSYIKGTLDNIVGTNMSVRTNNSSSSFTGNIALTGLPNMNNLYIDAHQIQLKTSYTDIVKIAPTLKKLTQPNISALGNVQYKGNFYGYIHSFTALGFLETAIGNVQTDINIKLQKGNIAFYQGKLGLQYFNLGTFIRNNDLNFINGEVTLNGQGVGKNATANLTTQLQRLDYNGYAYTNISANGQLSNNNYIGVLKITDPNLEFRFDVVLNMDKDSAKFSAVGELQKSNFKTIGFTKDDVQVTGLFDFNFKGKNIDDFAGYIKIFNTNVLHEGERLNVDSVVLQASTQGLVKTLSLQTNEIDANIKGAYEIMQLGETFKRMLHQYAPAYIENAKQIVKAQKFTYYIKTGNIDGYLSLFDKDLKGFSNTQLSGILDADSNQLTIDGTIPSFGYKQCSVDNLRIKGDGNKDNLNLDIQADNIIAGDSTYFPSTHIYIVTQKNISTVKVHTSANRTLSEASLEAVVATYEDGVAVNFNPSSFILNDKVWNIQKNGEIVYRNKNLSVNNIAFTSGGQQLIVQTKPSETTNYNDLYLQLKGIVLADFLPLAFKSPRIEGLANGLLVVTNPFEKDMHAYTDTALNIEECRFENKVVGNVGIKANYYASTGKLLYEITSPNTNYNFTAEGGINLKDSGQQLTIDKLVLNGLNLNIIQPYLGTVFSDMQGMAYGQLQASFNSKAPVFNGNILLQKTQLTVAYTNVSYAIDTAVLICKDGNIHFTDFNLKDRFNRTGKAKGILYMQDGFDKMAYDFDINAERLELLNTTTLSGQPFYGKATGMARFTFKGPQSNMKMSIAAQPTDSSEVFIRSSNSRQNADADFIVWKQYGTALLANKAIDKNNLTIDLDIKVNNLTSINMVLDEVTGDVIKATGSGGLRIHTGTAEPLTMRGRYDIEEGSYKFNFQPVSKLFSLQKDAGNFIEWTGDPLDARINIYAQYTAKDIRFSDLTTSLPKTNAGSFSSAVEKYRGDVYVIAKLTGKLSKPVIDFKLAFPAATPITNDIAATSFLQRIESDKNELLKQITYLIVFNSFAPYGEAKSNNGGGSLIGTTLSSIIATQLNNVVANILSKVAGRNLSINFNANFYSSADLLSGNSTLNSFERSQVNVKIGKSFFNNNIVVTFGSDFDFRLANTGSSSASSSSFRYLPNVNVEFILSKDRRLRAIVFYSNLPDPTTPSGQRNRSGASLSYKRDFDKLFGSKVEQVKDASSIKK